MAATQTTSQPQYLSPKQIHKAATGLVNEVTFHMALLNIPQPYVYELKTDKATVELRGAIERYIAKMQDERLPCEA